MPGKWGDKYHDTRRGAPIEYNTKMPQQGEIVGIVEKASGAANFIVRCADGKDRTCTIPGRVQRKFWIKMRDVVLVRPWVVQSDERADIVWRYSIMDADRLKKNGLMAGL